MTFLDVDGPSSPDVRCTAGKLQCFFGHLTPLNFGECQEHGNNHQGLLVRNATNCQTSRLSLKKRTKRSLILAALDSSDHKSVRGMHDARA